MREYFNKKDASKKNYRTDRFFIQNETPKVLVQDSKFATDAQNLAKFELNQIYVEFDTLVVCAKVDDVGEILKMLKSLGYEILCDISGVDFLSTRGGVEVFYQILDISRGFRARVKCDVVQKSFLPSVCEIYPNANWAERELYDMFGVWIKNHPNLKRILMPDDWYGHPLLKSYPLQGDEFARWYEIDKIFGRDRRDEFGAENRDSSFIDEKDTFNFARLHHESEFGAPTPQKPNLIDLQDKKPFLVKRASRDKFKLIKKRR